MVSTARQLALLFTIFRYARAEAGAADIASASPLAATPFQQTPAKPLSFPSLLIASTDDPYGSLDHARRLSLEWQSRLVVAGALGHINESSHLGDWPQGRALLDAFCAGMPRTA